jgi:Putative zinc-finger
MLDSTDCSTLEEVAALAEGRLRGASRERLIAHLAGCADCREVLAETIEIGADLDAEERGAAPAVVELRPAAVARRPSRAWVMRGGAVAATLAIVAGSIAAWQMETRKHPPSRDEWMAQMPQPQQLVPHVWGGVVMRGGGGGGVLTRQGTELGALLVNLDVTVAAGDGARAAEFADRMAAILDEAGWQEGDVGRLRAIAAERDAAVIRRSLGAELPGIEERLRERFSPFDLDLGAFLEEAQIAAAVGRDDFLASRATRRHLDWLLSQESLPIAVREQLQILARPQASSAQRAEAALNALRALTY